MSFFPNYFFVSTIYVIFAAKLKNILVMIKRNNKYFTTVNSKEVDNFLNRAYNLHDVEVNQKYGDNDSLPYSYHLKLVVQAAIMHMSNVLMSYDDIMPVLFGAAFHDSIEDARQTYNDIVKIAKEYMSEDQAIMAAEIVYAVTNEKGKTRGERANDKYYAGIRATKYAPFIKMCDRMANMSHSFTTHSSMAKKYAKEMLHFIESIVDPINQEKKNEYSIPDSLMEVALQFTDMTNECK